MGWYVSAMVYVACNGNGKGKRVVERSLTANAAFGQPIQQFSEPSNGNLHPTISLGYTHFETPIQTFGFPPL